MKFRGRTWPWAALTVLWMACAGSVKAQQASVLDARMKKGLADPVASAAAISSARKVTFFCNVCHGEDGSSVKGEVPNLAGQNPSYLLTQIEKFSRGQRRNEFMEGLMRLLTEEERINVAIFYASKPIKPATAGGSLAGKAIYIARCIRCHGEQAHGNETTPRLAGQQVPYLSLSLKRYRDRSGERIYAPMSASTAGLKEADIAALTAYLSSLP